MEGASSPPQDCEMETCLVALSEGNLDHTSKFGQFFGSVGLQHSSLCVSCCVVRPVFTSSAFR